MLATKKRKILTTNKQNESVISSMDTGIESDLGSSGGEFSLPQVKRKVLGARQVSFSVNNKLSFESADFHQTSGYGSLLSSSSSLSPQKSLSGTPRKRKSEATDENAFYNSYQFVSPLKIRKSDENHENRAKKILKEKSSSENVILCSTPIRNNRIWGKFRSLHQEKGAGLVGSPQPPLAPTEEASFDCCSFDFAGSFELTESHDKDTPVTGLDQLLAGNIDLSSIVKKRPNASETASKSEKNVSGCSTTSNRTKFYCGRLKLDILGKLYEQQNLALGKIFGHLDEIDILSLSHVSKDYRNMIKSNKIHEPKRQNYLKAYRKVKENQIPGNRTLPTKLKTEKKKFGQFGDVNVNHSMQLRPKPQSPPVSPSKRKFHDNQKIAKSHTGPIFKCPRCFKPATVNSIKIRSSPRKKKSSSILKLSTTAGRVQKKTFKTFLTKPSIESHSLSDALYVTFPHSDSDSNSGSPSTVSSDESGCESHETETYEYAECTGKFCSFKFCIGCHYKYHPRQRCKELSPASPSRDSANKSSVACSNKSLKSLKRLVY